MIDPLPEDQNPQDSENQFGSEKNDINHELEDPHTQLNRNTQENLQEPSVGQSKQNTEVHDDPTTDLELKKYQIEDLNKDQSKKTDSNVDLKLNDKKESTTPKNSEPSNTVQNDNQAPKSNTQD